MCGRFVAATATADLVSEFNTDETNVADWQPSYSVVPSQEVPIIREHIHEEETLRAIDLATWGFWPSWAKPGGPAPINARLETIASNRLFSGAFASQRMICPMTGYFEWQEQPDGKQPYYIHSDTEILAAAGLYTSHQEGDEWKVTFTIITTAGRDRAGEVHDRMPVFLTPDIWNSWLRPEKITVKDEMLAMLDRSSIAMAKTLTAYPVDRKANNVRTLDRNDPTLIEPISLVN